MEVDSLLQIVKSEGVTSEKFPEKGVLGTDLELEQFEINDWS